MNPTLYIYDDKTLKELEAKLHDYHFFSIAYFLHRCDTVDELEELDATPFENSIIDITNLVKDGNYFRIFTERYLWALSENFANIQFCLHYNFLESFMEWFPYFFDEKDINFDFHNESDEKDQGKKELTLCAPLNLCIYDNPAVAKKLNQKGSLISLSDLVEECEGIVFRYNIDSIADTLEKNKVEYIDISSVIRTLKLRRDLVFQFEILLHHISKAKEIKYCIEDSLVSEVSALFPFAFSKERYINDDDDDKGKTEDETPKEIDVEEVKLLANKICETLKGHATFKSDFQHNLLKFSFLNAMGERKILSIILCGDSGIGKTEFAKIASHTMFPSEPLIKINFGNYSTEGVLNSLIGSPLGYIGSEEGGELINKISMSKSRVILIDEFERATPSVFNFFYELLEDGIFTDRHGVEHNLNGYIIVFTSNMTQAEYQKHIPNSLKSRFDMVYYFVDLPVEEKTAYILNTASSLIEKLKTQFKIQVMLEKVQSKLNELVRYNNLRDIKRKIEDIVFNEFFECYKDK